METLVHHRLSVLLIEDDSDDRLLLSDILFKNKEPSFKFELLSVSSLQVGLEVLAKGGIDVVLLDLNLPDSQGLDTVTALQGREQAVPVVVLSGMRDESIAVKAVHNGAQDYLIKGQVDHARLVRALRYAVERKQAEADLRSLSVTDPLTQLYNRRGFLALVEQRLLLAQRDKKEFLLFFADVDALKAINDTLGHSYGDQALVETAHVLHATFRESDILARIGGDEFAIVATHPHPRNVEIYARRLHHQLEKTNATRHLLFKLSLSMGVARLNPKKPASLQQLLSQADADLYRHKRAYPVRCVHAA